MNSFMTIARQGLVAVTVFCAGSCTKESITLPGSDTGKTMDGFTEYTIAAGNHYSNNAGSVAINTMEYKFDVQFDSTAIYTLSAKDQYDINKLSGFADNGMTHLQYSARFGWRWSDGKLRLFAFVHNSGVITEKEIAAIIIGKTYRCSIKVNGSNYVFSVDGVGNESLPRSATTPTGQGYRLYPYFGGNNVAPHEIHIRIRYLD
jgi:hypothetical protein